ncbi:hypothetical protein [Rhizobium leguminosarum]|uniref:hypothetical protein n=1 Tax=Rhizobium TaxID=379 RepID=UPI001F15F46F|nr:hypothetical protein [Rhizobium leguminosarum]UIK20910.1 hypothetical protein LZK79_31550 [Rhizobium leguminosarum]
MDQVRAVALRRDVELPADDLLANIRGRSLRAFPYCLGDLAFLVVAAEYYHEEISALHDQLGNEETRGRAAQMLRTLVENRTRTE